MDDLVRRFESARREIAGGALDSICRLCERLIEFFGRKSLSEWHREELVDWIAELRERAADLDPEAAASLHQRFVSAVSEHLGMSEEEMQGRLENFVDSLDGDDEISGRFDDEDEDDWQPDAFEADDADEGPDAADWERFESRDQNQGNASSTRAGAARLTDPGWLRSLFRRAAQALHPDREADPERRALRQGQMQRLLQARKDGDVLTMLRLYAEAGGSSELALAESEMADACELMKQRLTDLAREEFEIIEQSPQHAWVHSLFYAAKPKTRDQRLKRWEKVAQQDVDAIKRTLDELRNLKVLKAYLERRRYE
ncbi:MAG: hypothetical protein RQ741_09155 [Wenzhouxiangellaceae bacterium]|nr:hypothetical protein [Wenzhouxiangellaceae bacterium]